MKTFIFSALLIIAAVFMASCKKDSTNNTVPCDSKQPTLLIATQWRGTLGYYNDLRKWAVNVSIPNSVDGVRTCIICSDLPDSLKVLGSTVTFSGELKASDNNPKPTLGGQEIYFVNPTLLKR